MTLIDELRPVWMAHLAAAAVFGLVYGWRAAAVVIGVGLAWSAVLAVTPPTLARKRPWTPRK